MVEVTLRSVKNFILDSVSTSFPSGRLSIIVGPNGAGKTTLLKVVAGLVSYEGSVYFDGKCVDELPPYERGVSYVPQNNALFTNMTVWDNIAFGLRVRGFDEGYVREKVEELISMFKLESVARRYPATLSGGEARKVALARALAVDPKVLLLDEPFASLDAETQAAVEQEVMMTVKKLGRTILMVTHTIERAVANAEKLHVLWGGKLLFSGKPSELSTELLPEDARYWLGSVIEVDEVHHERGLCYAEVNGFRIPVVCGRELRKSRKVFIPATSAKICRRGKLRGRVVSVRRSSTYFRACVSLGDALVYVITPIQLKLGEEVNLRIDKAVVIGDHSEQ